MKYHRQYDWFPVVGEAVQIRNNGAIIRDGIVEAVTHDDTILWLGADGLFSTFASQVPTWGLIALTFIYPSTGRRLRADLYPEWLRRPVAPEGSPA